MQLSELMREQIDEVRPLERAVRAIENVARRGGARHLRPASCRLSVFQRELWDVYFVLFAAFFLLCYVAWNLAKSSRLKLSQWIKRSHVSSPKSVKKTQ